MQSISITGLGICRRCDLGWSGLGTELSTWPGLCLSLTGAGQLSSDGLAHRGGREWHT